MANDRFEDAGGMVGARYENCVYLPINLSADPIREDCTQQSSANRIRRIYVLWANSHVGLGVRFKETGVCS